MNMQNNVGVGLRIPHHHYFLSQKPDIGWLEVHSENYFVDHRLRQDLVELASYYPVSLHGVGLSLGSADPLNTNHLQQLKTLVANINPIFVSEHMSWSSINGQHFNDLLPLPYTKESLHNFAQHVDQTQQALGHQILIENPSSYLSFDKNTLTEWEFYAALPEMTGCGLLLDLNNIYVTSQNQGFEAQTYLDAVPFETVQEIHLAGHSQQILKDGSVLLIDTHAGPVSKAVWALYRQVIEQHDAIHTLIEWDTNLPEPDILLAESGKAAAILDHCCQEKAII